MRGVLGRTKRDMGAIGSKKRRTLSRVGRGKKKRQARKKESGPGAREGGISRDLE